MIQHIGIMIALENQKLTCKGCGEECDRSYNYCPNCGRKNLQEKVK